MAEFSTLPGTPDSLEPQKEQYVITDSSSNGESLSIQDSGPSVSITKNEDGLLSGL